MRKHGKTFTMRLTDEQDCKLERLAALSHRTKQGVLRLLLENAKLSDTMPGTVKADLTQDEQQGKEGSMP